MAESLEGRDEGVTAPVASGTPHDTGPALLPERYDVFREYSNVLRGQRSHAIDAFDQAVLKLSSAGLGLSLAFIRSAVELADAILLWALVSSWIAFGLAIISTVSSLVSSRVSMDAMLELARRGYLLGDESALGKVPLSVRITASLNWASAIAFIAGIVLTVVFVGFNL